MSGLDFAQAPPPQRPLRWLLSVPVWGIVAGAFLIAHGESALLSRWSPHTVALVHLFTLGVLGNAMLGSLLQFLPVAAGTPLPLGRSAAWLHAAFNLGLAVFTLAMLQMHRTGLGVASVLLAVPILAFAAAALPGLLKRGAQQVLRSGLAMAVLALAVTAVAGAVLVAILRGDVPLPLESITDAHATIGLLGAVLGLMAAVGSVTLPMFQGTEKIPDRWLGGWIALTVVSLAIGTTLRIYTGLQQPLVVSALLPALLFVGTSLWLPLRRLYQRNPTLVWTWRLGTLAVGAACVITLAGTTAPLSSQAVFLAGTLAIAIGLPMMLTGMMLEIIGFLAWIHLRRDCPRGMRVPGVGTLVPDRDKWIVLAMQLLTAAVLIGAVLEPALLARSAGLMLVLSWATVLTVQLRGMGRARAFRRENFPATDATSGP
ncbi:hypothetical protein WCE55_09290 [Luteimonas sp. MJ293]|uniref:hypothetical protein n=1 Tax=Luteimonas sp. MJ146 TaxID=3129240 RepID=UPI0031BAAEF7